MHNKKEEDRMNHIWIGNFENEFEFEKYICQKEYFEKSNEYDCNTNSNVTEKDIKDARSQFCKEIDIDFYDEDFLIIKFLENLSFYDFTLSIPAKYSQISKIISKKKIKNANAYFVIDTKSLPNKPTFLNSTKLTYLGEFEEETPQNSKDINFSIWVGTTNKSKVEFAKLFENGKQSPFCKEIGLNKFNPKSLKWFHFDFNYTVEGLYKNCLPSEFCKLPLNLTFEKEIKTANVLVFYFESEYKGNQKIKIFPKKYVGKYPMPPKSQLEKDDYFGLKFIGNFRIEK